MEPTATCSPIDARVNDRLMYLRDDCRQCMTAFFDDPTNEDNYGILRTAIDTYRDAVDKIERALDID